MAKAKPATSLMFPEATSKALASLKGKLTKLLDTWGDEVSVVDTPSFEHAGEGVRDLTSIRKDLKQLLGPIVDEAKKDYDAKRKAFKEIDDVIESKEAEIRSALEAYAQAQRAAREKLIAKNLDKGKDTIAAAIAAKPFVPEVQGLSFTERWHAEVTSLLDLVKAVASGKAPIEALSPDYVWLNIQARSFKEKLSIPGVKAVSESSSTIRS